MTSATFPWLIVVAGGRSKRFGSDKVAVLLDETLAGLPPDWPIVAVGPSRPTIREVTWVREDPPFAGPLAAVGAGLPLVPDEVDHIVVVAADMPAAGAAVRTLVGACGPGVDAAVLVDATGFRQPLLACYCAATLRQRLGSRRTLVDGPARALLKDAVVVEQPDRWHAAHDVDTAADIANRDVSSQADVPSQAVVSSQTDAAAGIRLRGQLVCSDDEAAVIVIQHLPRHLALTRAEPGCLAFEVTRTDDPFVWSVDEHFSDAAAFRSHQERVSASEWGRVTAGIERRYTIDGLDDGST